MPKAVEKKVLASGICTWPPWPNAENSRAVEKQVRLDLHRISFLAAESRAERRLV
jgi:hypothetical protein